MQNSPSESVFDALKDYQDVAMEFTSVREFLLSKAHRIDEVDFTDLDIMERCKLIAEIQDCLYDLQLIEWAERSSFIAFITSIFLLSKSRCTKRKELEKSDPSLIQNDDETTNNEQHQHDIDVENLSMDNKRKRVSRSDYAMESYFQEQEGLLIINHCPDSSNPNNDSEIDSLKAEVNTERKRCRYKRSDNASFRDSPFSVVSPECVENSGREADDCESDDCEPHSQKHDNHENDADNEDNVDDKKIVDETDASQSQLANKPLLSSRKRPVTSTLSDNSYSRPGGSPRKKTNSSSRIEESLEEPDPNSDEPTYCLCKQVSYGDMVCCDNPACSVEWFHFECVNVKTKPKGRWLCPDCKPSTQQNRKQ